MADRFVALLRGINVGKAKRIAMADLKALVKKLGFQDVATLLNSGNVVFTMPPGVKGDVAQRLEKGIANKLGVVSRVTAISGEELKNIIREDPFKKDAASHSRYLVGVVSNPDDLAKIKHLVKEKWSPEAMALGERAVYLWCASGILESKMLMAISKLLKDGFTSRNWATLLKLQAMVDEP